MRVAWAAWVQGLTVSTDMPTTVYDLMDLYPQGAEGRPSVLYVPFRRGWQESLPLLLSLFL